MLRFRFRPKRNKLLKFGRLFRFTTTFDIDFGTKMFGQDRIFQNENPVEHSSISSDGIGKESMAQSWKYLRTEIETLCTIRIDSMNHFDTWLQCWVVVTSNKNGISTFPWIEKIASFSLQIPCFCWSWKCDAVDEMIPYKLQQVLRLRWLWFLNVPKNDPHFYKNYFIPSFFLKFQMPSNHEKDFQQDYTWSA